MHDYNGCDYVTVHWSGTGGGYSEFVFGEWMRTRKIPREAIVVSTKAAGGVRPRTSPSASHRTLVERGRNSVCERDDMGANA